MTEQIKREHVLAYLEAAKERRARMASTQVFEKLEGVPCGQAFVDITNRAYADMDMCVKMRDFLTTWGPETLEIESDEEQSDETP